MEEEAVDYFVECYKDFILKLGNKWNAVLFLGEHAYIIQKQIIQVAILTGLLSRGEYASLYNKDPEGLVKRVYEKAKEVVK